MPKAISINSNPTFFALLQVNKQSLSYWYGSINDRCSRGFFLGQYCLRNIQRFIAYILYDHCYRYTLKRVVSGHQMTCGLIRMRSSFVSDLLILILPVIRSIGNQILRASINGILCMLLVTKAMEHLLLNQSSQHQ